MTACTATAPVAAVACIRKAEEAVGNIRKALSASQFNLYVSLSFGLIPAEADAIVTLSPCRNPRAKKELA